MWKVRTQNLPSRNIIFLINLVRMRPLLKPAHSGTLADNRRDRDMWSWLESLEGGAANFVGSFTGAVVGLVAIVIGALFNAHLNRKRDDRLKKADARAIAAALKAELEGIDKTLLENADDLEKGTKEFMVPNLAH